MQLLKNIIFSAGIFAVSLFVILLFGSFQPEAFLVDDNRTQWYPVIEHAYSDFFESGVMPTYDFFQMKGLAIGEPGYYSLVNPVMLISYMLSHFTPLPFSTITIHIALLFSLGNLCFFLVCREFEHNIPMSALLTAAYSVQSCFFAFSYWYYVFNNYFFVPLLMLVFMKSRGKWPEYFGCGIVLALEILFGNIQYTCYHYMIYGLICLTYAVLKNRRYIGIFFSNVICAGILSSPFLLLLIRASDDFASDGFHHYEIWISELLLGVMLPVGVLELLGVTYYPFFTNGSMGRADNTWFYNGGFAAVWLVLLIYGISRAVKNRKQISGIGRGHSFKEQCGIIINKIKSGYRELVRKKGDNVFLITGLSVCALFFISFVSNGLVAFILGFIPVIKQFRYLFKCLFVLMPVMAVLTTAVLPHIRPNLKKISVILCCVFTVIGMANSVASTMIASSIFTDETTVSIEKEEEYGRAFDEVYMSDSDSFRYITLMQKNYKLTRDMYHCYNGYLRNFPTALELYSISGYEISAPASHMEQFAYLYPIDEGFSRMVNCSSSPVFAATVSLYPDEVSRQLVSNSVKYIYVQKEAENVAADIMSLIYSKDREAQKTIPNLYDEEEIDFTGLVVNAVEKLEGVQIAEVRSLNEYFDVIVLEGVNGLCEDPGGNVLPLTAERMDLLSFEDNGSGEYTLSFSYEAKLEAYTVDADGKKLPLDISEADDENVVIRAASGGNGRIYLGYSDPICTVSFVFEILIIALFLAMLVILLITSRKGSHLENKGEPA